MIGCSFIQSSSVDILPAYKKMFTPVREKDIPIYFHSDWYIMEIAEDLVKTGITILNLQDPVNCIGITKKKLKGKVCIDLDIDRQKIIPFGSQKEIEKHVKYIISEPSSPEE